MPKESKIWFKGFSRTLWVPVSVEGWGTCLAFALALFSVYLLNEISADVAFALSKHWPIIFELTVITILFYWISHGHVDKKY